MSPVVALSEPPKIIQGGSANSVSPRSAELRNTLNGIAEHLDGPVTLTKEPLFSALVEISDECKLDGWDGYAGKAIHVSAIVEAGEFVQRLATSIDMPVIVPQPSGHIAFEWEVGNQRMIISTMGNNRLSFAVLYQDGTENCGVSKFYTGIPKEIAAILHSDFSSFYNH